MPYHYIYIVAPNVRLANEIYCKQFKGDNTRLVYIDSPNQLRGLKGEGQPLYIYMGGKYHTDRNLHYEITSMAFQHDFALHEVRG